MVSRVAKFLCLLSILVGAGCATGRGGDDAQVRGGRRAVKQKFKEDVPCGDVEARSSKAGWIAEGCGEVGLYAAACNVFGFCANVHGQVVSRLVRKQASFDLRCEKLQISSLNDDTFGVRGCERQASYVVVDCFRGGCKVVQNTQTQR